MVRARDVLAPHVACPVCRHPVSLGRIQRVPFVVVRLICGRCGTYLTIMHPAYQETELPQLPSCLDCGNPLPDLRRHALRGLEEQCSAYRRLKHTCPVCWCRHRADEPGDDLETFLGVWTGRSQWPRFRVPSA